jgi:hypothetical protein
MDRRILADYRDTFVGAGLLLFSGLYWLGAAAIRVSPLEGSVGAAGLPKALAVVLAILSLYLIARNLLSLRAQGGRVAAAPEPVPATRPDEAAGHEEEKPFSIRQHLRALSMLAFGVGYLLILPELGYAVSVTLLLGAVAYFLGLRGLPKVALFAVLGGAFFFLLFVVTLKIPLPEGIFSNLLRR